VIVSGKNSHFSHWLITDTAFLSLNIAVRSSISYTAFTSVMQVGRFYLHIHIEFVNITDKTCQLNSSLYFSFLNSLTFLFNTCWYHVIVYLLVCDVLWRHRLLSLPLQYYLFQNFTYRPFVSCLILQYICKYDEEVMYPKEAFAYSIHAWEPLATISFRQR